MGSLKAPQRHLVLQRPLGAEGAKHPSSHASCDELNAAPNLWDRKLQWFSSCMSRARSSRAVRNPGGAPRNSEPDRRGSSDTDELNQHQMEQKQAGRRLALANFSVSASLCCATTLNTLTAPKPFKRVVFFCETRSTHQNSGNKAVKDIKGLPLT